MFDMPVKLPESQPLTELHYTIPQNNNLLQEQQETTKMVQNVLLGIAIGDAFGVGIEMKDREWIIRNIDFSKYVCVREAEYALGYSLGDYSDDTSDTIAVINALMKSIIQNQVFSEDLLLSEIQKEYELTKSEKGVPRAGFGSLAQYFEGKMTLDQVKEAQRKKNYPGNAPPMRAVPIGLINQNLITPYAIINANVSHPHPKARAASIIVAQAARYMLVEKRPQSEIIKVCREFIKDIDPETYEYLGKIDLLNDAADVFTTPPSVEFQTLVGPQPTSPHPSLPPFVGLNVDAMRTAGTMLYILKHSKSTFEAFKRAIQIGGDVDSLAAIVTGIMGGRFGLDDLPEFLIEKVEGREKLSKLAKQYLPYVTKD